MLNIGSERQSQLSTVSKIIKNTNHKESTLYIGSKESLLDRANESYLQTEMNDVYKQRMI